MALEDRKVEGAEQTPVGAVPVRYQQIRRGSWQEVSAAIIEETAVCIHVNGRELATFMATPMDQEAMALGFLRSEGFIGGLDDIELIRLAQNETCVDVWLKHKIEWPQREIRTSGCGGGLTFDDLTSEREPLAPGLRVTPDQISRLYVELQTTAKLYPITRGVHASALATPEALLLCCEDVGRHNTLDKLWGRAMLAGIETEGRIIVTTGRISSEMLGKAAKMGTPIIASRTSPTSRSVALARAWNITLIGYLRRDSMRVYSAPERLQPELAGN